MSDVPTYEEALNFMSDALLYQRIDLTGPWVGWRIRGQYLVSPDNERIMMRELIGLLVHYRRKFCHHPRAAQPVSQEQSNVIPFIRAADARPQPKKVAA